MCGQRIIGCHAAHDAIAIHIPAAPTVRDAAYLVSSSCLSSPILRKQSLFAVALAPTAAVAGCSATPVTHSGRQSET
jgi:hypothetical protein